MTSASDPTQWQRVISASTLVDVLAGSEDVTDIVRLSGPDIAKWTGQLPIPDGWQPVELGLGQTQQSPNRISVYRASGDAIGAVETIDLFGYTGWLGFREVLSNADCTFRDLRAHQIVTTVLPIPVTARAAALRTTGKFVIGQRPVWGQQSNYLAGSEDLHAGRLIIHSVYAATDQAERLVDDIASVSDAVYQRFIAELAARPAT